MADYRKKKNQNKTEYESNITPLPWTSGSKLPDSYKKTKDFKLSDYSFDFKVNEFAIRNLNKYRNFLTTPKCDECNKPGLLVAESDEELEDFCCELLYANGHVKSGIFLDYLDGSHRVIFTIEDIHEPDKEDNEVYAYISEIGSFFSDDQDTFAKAEFDLSLEYFGLLIEREKGKWEIVE